MKNTISNLQEIINKKAKAKAEKDINDVISFLSKSGILEIEDYYVTENNEKRNLKYSLSQFNINNKDNIITKLYEIKLKKYINSETKDFVSKVEKLVEQADDLLNISNNY